MPIVVVCGPPAVGHNTIAELASLDQPGLAVIDVDDVREALGPIGM